MPSYDEKDYVAVHGDTNHRNWLLSDEKKLYLVDWDSAMLSDPAVDIGSILGRYVPVDKWSPWLSAYGIVPKKDVMERILWYGTMHQLEQIKVQYRKRNFQKMNEEILVLKNTYNYL